MKKRHEDRAHAPLSPSAGKRWMTCRGSFAAAENIKTVPSEAALEGTKAHEWAERLRKACETGDPNDYATQLAILERQDADMAFHVDNYIDFLDALKRNFHSDEYDEYEEYLETRVRFTDNIWGTLDYGCARRKKKGKWQAIIADFKYGRGVYVPAEDNEQLIIYLICLEDHIGVRFEKAWVYIYQPRYPKDKPYEKAVYTRAEIDVWRAKIKAAEKDCLDMKYGKKPLEFVAGEHCQFCPAQPQCPTFRDHIQNSSVAVLDEIDTLPDIERTPIEVLVQISKKKKEIEHYLQNVDHFLLARGLKKQDIGDLIVVEGQSRRQWIKDEDTIVKGLRQAGLQPYKKKLINIGDVEKKLGKKAAKLLSRLTTKPPGKLQLALPGDKRPRATFGKDSIALLDEL